MSLKPQQTAQVAKAAFPRGNRCLTLRDELGVLFPDAEFADLFPTRGQPAQAPWRLALLTILQYVENLADRQAAEAVRSRIDWKYLLGLELTDAGFDVSVPSTLRQLPAVRTLRQVWLQQFYREGETIRRREENEMPTAAECLNTPFTPMPATVSRANCTGRVTKPSSPRPVRRIART